MSKAKKTTKNLPVAKHKTHPRNKHQGRYDIEALLNIHPELASYIVLNKAGEKSIQFSEPEAVKSLNQALLKHYYSIDFWDIPSGYLCPPIPGRADYIHYLADLLASSNFGKLPLGRNIVGLDIGVGASCIYPLIGHLEYGWSFIASDIDPKSIKSSQAITDFNPPLKNVVTFKLQEDERDLLYGILLKEDKIDFTICNPPFHASEEEAKKGTLRKLNNLGNEKTDKATLNFGGQNAELFCKGGEKQFLLKLARESKKFASSCYWFSSLVSKKSHLGAIENKLKELDCTDIKIIPMGQGNKSSRIIAWTFLDKEQKKAWREERWSNK